MVDRLTTVAALFCGLSLAATVQAEINDPTRPPPGFGEHEPTGQAVPAAQEAALIVSSLFLMGDKPYAMVDGQIVRPGDPLGDGKIARIDVGGVWIRISGTGNNPAGLRQLKLLPEVVKTPSRARMEKR